MIFFNNLNKIIIENFIHLISKHVISRAPTFNSTLGTTFLGSKPNHMILCNIY